MKSLTASDSLSAMISICQSADEKVPFDGNSTKNGVYSSGFQSILDGFNEDDSLEDSGQISEKKKRLSVEQVKALEKNFEVENKLEPERKVKLAQELGLQPRQVAVWFQNRRARWKTKQLEKDYNLLKTNYETLRLNFSALQHDKEALLAELDELKSKLKDNNDDWSIKEITQETQDRHTLASESDNKASVQSKTLPEDSDSSAILDSPQRAISPNASLPYMTMMISPVNASSLWFDCGSSSASSANCLEFPETQPSLSFQKGSYHHVFRTEEHNFLNSSEESCNLFSDEQAPTLAWCCDEPWN